MPQLAVWRKIFPRRGGYGASRGRVLASFAKPASFILSGILSGKIDTRPNDGERTYRAGDVFGVAALFDENRIAALSLSYRSASIVSIQLPRIASFRDCTCRCA
ncbi:hypothetical protein [Hyphomicrobium facile]|uniref:hypothetical protein n=1 Tax=Hyphomicrobium facile TaxID=51670 RepID=UPI000B852886|nr:hypothetical protein [Hyphomicrobium facile]